MSLPQPQNGSSVQQGKKVAYEYCTHIKTINPTMTGMPYFGLRNQGSDIVLMIVLYLVLYFYIYLPNFYLAYVCEKDFLLLCLLHKISIPKTEYS